MHGQSAESELKLLLTSVHSLRGRGMRVTELPPLTLALQRVRAMGQPGGEQAPDTVRVGVRAGAAAQGRRSVSQDQCAFAL